MPSHLKPRAELILEFRAIHGDEFIYEKIEYKGTHVPIIVICKIHGEFSITPKAHLQRKQKCPHCSIIVRTFDAFVKKSNEKHDKDHYSYHLVKWINVNEPVEILCNRCQWAFWQRPSEHMRSKGCRKCSGCYTPTHEEFIAEAHQRFDNRYEYPEEYVECDAKIKIVCPDHGEFFQTPYEHLRSKGCGLCSKANISIGEKEWLDHLGIPNNKESRQVHYKIGGHKFVFDGFDRENKTVYEYYGDYWHGNINLPKFSREKQHPISKRTYGELYDKTMSRKKIVEDAGFKVIFIWESDWKIQKNKMKKKKWVGDRSHQPISSNKLEEEINS